MTRIILVRHGQTAWNVGAGAGERFRGRVDLPLDDTGLAQARAMAERLADHPIVAVYSSPLRRAMETAQPTAQKLGLLVQPLPGIITSTMATGRGYHPPRSPRPIPISTRAGWRHPTASSFPTARACARCASEEWPP